MLKLLFDLLRIYFALKKADVLVDLSSPFLSEDDLKPPPYSECAHGDEADTPRPSYHIPLISEGGDSISINEAPPPYTPSPPTQVGQQEGPASHSASQSENRPT